MFREMPCTFGLQLIAFVAGSDPGTCTMFSFGYTDACIEGKFFEVFFCLLFGFWAGVSHAGYSFCCFLYLFNVSVAIIKYVSFMVSLQIIRTLSAC